MKILSPLIQLWRRLLRFVGYLERWRDRLCFMQICIEIQRIIVFSPLPFNQMKNANLWKCLGDPRLTESSEICFQRTISPARVVELEHHGTKISDFWQKLNVFFGGGGILLMGRCAWLTKHPGRISVVWTLNGIGDFEISICLEKLPQKELFKTPFPEFELSFESNNFPCTLFNS